ncbi:S-adenosyl-L-methionine-dependent methyltransferase [Podospora fimiseda]|uniref:S-adenosyl-L-methionine-dependent methyltransferase n=1 Tax=Podospora fimiseda TaxID=252190 RepID=A0AAN7BES3_9PEZI|nr:S-adenosyl-L-methionine-dependent methyltransferase [Podospora fimiseda]
MHLDTFNHWAAIYEQSTGGVTRKVATHLISHYLRDAPLTSSSIILDNAAGPGIVTSEILKTNPPDGTKIHVIDASPAMIDIAHELYPPTSYPSITCAVMPGEQLSFPDETFTHSITNIGILVFQDGQKGAKEIYRTLKKGEGRAIITSWSHIGFAKPLAEASLAVRPEEGTPFRLPIDPVWLDPQYLEVTMREAGFGDEVKVEQVTFGIGVESSPLFFEAFRPEMIKFLEDWKEEHFERIKEEFVKRAEGSAVDLEGNLAVRMCASVAICQK